ncbi:5'-nucleotidase C-terminal domain-containing protein [Thiomicrorhabdus indica]|uniref:5'-nucleotidase C-terminal domain-containing protein n=1 Tax=Thiomicrorhabdus indica TaxID=2267253 RepID=UPI00102DB9C7|nr:5'-nucleotidase C-terminal domain-containing protein [Thiomicrorhabdus indica]
MKLSKLNHALKTAFIGASIVTASFALTACNSDSDSEPQALEMTILHINDHHSHLEEDSMDITLGADEYEVASGGFPRVVEAFKTLEGQTASGNVLKLHAGDAMTGTLYYTLFQGEADAAMMNEVCFDAFALGNHEFDSSDSGLKTFLDFLNPAENAKCPTTPVLAANVVPTEGTPLYPAGGKNMLSPYTIKEFNDEKVGIIGIDIKSKTQNSSSPLDSTQFLDELETAQKYIDELEADGINKIILLTHYQYANDLTLASNLDGVDVIVGGDSHSLLGDFDQYGLNSQGDYPTKVTDKSGNTVCVVQAWQYAQVVGELNVSFNADGQVENCSGTPHLLVESESSEVNALLANETNLRVTTANSEAQTTLNVYAADVEVLKLEKIAEASGDLCLERIPGQGRSNICTADDTKPHGGDIQQLVAQAFYEMDPRSDIAIQNAGGVRVDVPAGDITTDTAYTLLPFSNTLVELEMTGAQIKQVLEEATENAVKTVEPSTGAYPYAAGLRWDMDLTQTVGNRLSNLEYKARGSDTWVTFNESATYIVLTNDYIAGGKDGYATFAEITGDKYIDTFLDYAQSFSDYAKEQGTVSKLPYSEYSTQNFTDTEGNFYGTKAE